MLLLSTDEVMTLRDISDDVLRGFSASTFPRADNGDEGLPEIIIVEGENAFRGDVPGGLEMVRGDVPGGLNVFRGDVPGGLNVVRGDVPGGLNVFRGDIPGGLPRGENDVDDRFLFPVSTGEFSPC